MHTIYIQNTTEKRLPIAAATLKDWARLPLRSKAPLTLTIRFVTMDEIRTLNQMYRKKDSPTNVLAFPSAIPAYVMQKRPVLGDIVICPEVLHEESKKGKKPLKAHWAHIIIHGVLHLLGYDHIATEDARIMQILEVCLLYELGFSNPYLEYTTL